MLLALLVLRRATLVLRRLADRLRLAHLASGATAWLVCDHWRDGWQLTPMVLGALGAGLAAAAA
ncbi:hypothetical protein [Nocardiopsis alborubida]|uniref:Uncharacterized protein n=1 Tax=Nocardiopsis alborubida TaxID=146802 RepID=A0A7X6MA86_9ACTN|nr:hypothetical protein [Nocardiopsis alborubida]NKY96874.1 hypothetical protein [Nocardiopsis alborubida]